MENIQQSKILFCDFNGVISYDIFWQDIKEESHPLHKYYEPIRDIYLDKERGLAKNWMLGKITTEDVHRTLSDQTGVPYLELLEVFEKGCRGIDLSKPILEKIQTLKDRYFCILSTGNMDSLDRFTIPSNPILKETFHSIDNSYNLGLFKTSNNGEYFISTAKKYGIEMKNCVVIDDSKKICDLFDTLGGVSYCVTGEDNVLDVLEQL